MLIPRRSQMHLKHLGVPHFRTLSVPIAILLPVVQSGVLTTRDKMTASAPSSSSCNSHHDSAAMDNLLSLSGHCLSYSACYSQFIITGGIIDTASSYPQRFLMIRIDRDEALAANFKNAMFYEPASTCPHPMHGQMHHNSNDSSPSDSAPSTASILAALTTDFLSNASQSHHDSSTATTSPPSPLASFTGASPPERRLSHVQALFHNTLVFFGGWNGTNVLRDLWIAQLDSESNVRWIPLEALRRQKKRVSSGHKRTFSSFLSNVFFNRTASQSDVPTSSTQFTSSSLHQDSFVQPSPRSNMAFSSFQNRKELIIFGGLGELVEDIYADMWIFSLKTLEWRKVALHASTKLEEQQQKQHRISNTSVSNVREQQTHTTSHVAALRETHRQMREEEDRMSPLPRSRSSTMFADEDRDRVFIFGGCNIEHVSCSNHLFEISFVDSAFSEAQVKRVFPLTGYPEPEQRLFSVGHYLKSRNSIIIFGGRSINKHLKYDDVWEFSLSRRMFEKRELKMDAISGHASCITAEERIYIQGGNGVNQRCCNFRMFALQPPSPFASVSEENEDEEMRHHDEYDQYSDVNIVTPHCR